MAVNTPIAVLVEEGEKDADIAAFLANDNPSPAPAVGLDTQSLHKEAISAATASRQAEAIFNQPISQSANHRLFASPLARRIAGEKGIDLKVVNGSGPHGRVVKADVVNFRPAAAAGAARPTSTSPNARQLADMLGMAYEAQPVSKMRSVIASRLLESKQTIPHFYLTVECNIDALLEARKQINAAADGKYKLSVNDFVIKASALALKAVPAANAAWTDEAIIQYDHADISVAVATPTGLITPIIKEAEHKGLAAISVEMKDLAKKARDGKLAPHEFQGGTFSVSNLGMYGISEFSAIINPPQSCILAVGAGQERPYVDNGQVKIGNFMSCTLSTDHRTVDGAVGAEFLQYVKRYIETPAAMLL